MGNICGKESDPFSKPGRRLDSAPTPATSAAVPASASAGPKPAKVVGGPPRRLGGSSSDQGGGGGNADEARRNAALAAEVSRFSSPSVCALFSKGVVTHGLCV